MADAEMSKAGPSLALRRTKPRRGVASPSSAATFAEAWVERRGTLASQVESSRLVRLVSAALLVVAASLAVAGGLV
jgi:hypothetical protein